MKGMLSDCRAQLIFAKICKQG
ncbi:hypothetical protein HMPREF9138_01042, partial [Prevotella histicola F0411]